MKKGSSPSLRSMFEQVSPSYDLLNHILTFGLDRGWRLKASRACLEDAPQTVLDLCCGTGDLLSSVRGLAPNGTSVLGVDFSGEMIARAHGKMRNADALLLADAGHLPFKNESFDCVATAFSFRNLLYKNPRFEDYLHEVVRILRQGGSFVIVETSQPEGEVLRKAYHGYLGRVIPVVGSAVSGNKSAYSYLSKSARRFPAPEEVSTTLRDAGFSKVTFDPLSFGVVGIHKATI
jgi:demethylmenaquinone methyltransferase/2-methoxy-6-polyprenyl-1,4-benzoquinol methylase